MKVIDLEDLARHTKKALAYDIPKPTEEDIQQFKPLVEWLVHQDVKLNEKQFSAVKRKYRFDHKKSFIFHIYLELKKRNEIDSCAAAEERISKHLQIKPCKSWSGIVTITVFTAAYPEFTNSRGERVKQEFSCAFDCAYCPKQPGQPRSYIDAEPGVLRANRNEFDCVKQIRDRMYSLYMTGNAPLKCEIIVSGGTWTSYPPEYRQEFCRDIYYAANVFWDEGDKRAPLSLHKEKYINQNAKSRIIGITIETRPDTIMPLEIKRLRDYGVTRVQLGIQHIDDEILKKVNRRCTTDRAIKAIHMLKANGFKIDAHWMPNLPGSTIEKDRHMLIDILLGLNNIVVTEIDNDVHWEHYDLACPELSVDYWKLYPTAVTPWTDIEKWYRDGTYVQYPEKDTFDMFIDVHRVVYPFLRLNRIIRDIPKSHIYNEGTGSDNTNMRQELNDTMARLGIYSMDIRNREVKNKYWDGHYVLVIRKYMASGGSEYFISAESDDKKVLYGFARLRFNDNNDGVVFDEIRNSALVRELRCYGQLRSVGEMGNHIQHKGLGRTLMTKAEELAKNNGFSKIAVIAGEGTKPYYTKLGYSSSGGPGDYMMKLLVKPC